MQQGMRSPLLPEFVSSIVIHNHVTVLKRVVCVFVMFFLVLPLVLLNPDNSSENGVDPVQ